MNPDFRRLRFSFACLLLAGFTSISSLGCDQIMVRRAMPAPLHDPVENTFTGQIRGIWGGDNFNFDSGKETHFLLLRGLDSPNPGEPFYNEAKRVTNRLTRGKELTVHVFERDEVMREIVDIMVPVGKTKGDFDSDEFELGLEIMKRGWARYNGASFDGAERLIEAEADAKQRKVGIWAEPKLKKSLKKKSPKKKSNDKK